MKNLKKLTESEKIDYLITKIDQIEKVLNPPLWKKFLSWFLRNFWTLLFLALISYLLWQVWEIVQSVQQTISGVENKFTDFKSTIEMQIVNLENQISSLGLEKLKFWK